MTPRPPSLSVLIISYNEKENLSACLDSLSVQTLTDFEIVVVDNGSTDGSIELLQSSPHISKAIFLDRNAGYAGGNNVGMLDCFNRGVQLVLLLNADTVADPDLLHQLVQSYHSKRSKTLGLIQPVLLLESDHSLVNTIGNAIHYCGFGYCKDYLRKFTSINLKDDREIQSASGAALLVSKQYFEAVGSLDEDFFMYNEDQNYSWRGLLLGFRHFLASEAVLYHRYSFSKNAVKMYHSEKNRWLMLLSNYQWLTLVMLAPILLVMEALLVLHSLLNGWFIMKVRSYGYILTHGTSIHAKRRQVQSHRVLSDREILLRFDSEITSNLMNNKLFTAVLNPILKTYYRLVLSLLKE